MYSYDNDELENTNLLHNIILSITFFYNHYCIHYCASMDATIVGVERRIAPQNIRNICRKSKLACNLAEVFCPFLLQIN